MGPVPFFPPGIGVVFQSTHPVWGGTAACPVAKVLLAHFNPPTPCGVGRPRIPARQQAGQISIHPPRVGWDGKDSLACLGAIISIHPPRVGWDNALIVTVPAAVDFNPPTPCGVGLMDVYGLNVLLAFQSTHPVWGGTRLNERIDRLLEISIHPPRVGWDIHTKEEAERYFISIHPPRVGWDAAITLCLSSSVYFNPPTPCGVGRPLMSKMPEMYAISIHPPRVGWDVLRLQKLV